MERQTKNKLKEGCLKTSGAFARPSLAINNPSKRYGSSPYQLPCIRLNSTQRYDISRGENRNHLPNGNQATPPSMPQLLLSPEGFAKPAIGSVASCCREKKFLNVSRGTTGCRLDQCSADIVYSEHEVEHSIVRVCVCCLRVPFMGVVKQSAILWVPCFQKSRFNHNNKKVWVQSTVCQSAPDAGHTSSWMIESPNFMTWHFTDSQISIQGQVPIASYAIQPQAKLITTK